jgi:hypothetical protein
MVDREPANPGSEPLVKPEFVPPIHSDKVAKPLMGEFVSNNVCYPVAVAIC